MYLPIKIKRRFSMALLFISKQLRFRMQVAKRTFLKEVWVQEVCNNAMKQNILICVTLKVFQNRNVLTTYIYICKMTLNYSYKISANTTHCVYIVTNKYWYEKRVYSWILHCRNENSFWQQNWKMNPFMDNKEMRL